MYLKVSVHMHIILHFRDNRYVYKIDQTHDFDFGLPVLTNMLKKILQARYKTTRYHTYSSQSWLIHNIKLSTTLSFA